MKNVFKAALFMLVLVLSAGFASANNPDVNAIADQAINEGAALVLQLTATAADSGSASIISLCQISSTTGLCVSPYTTVDKENIAVGGTVANVTMLSATTAEFRWTPSFLQAGAYLFNFSISDDDSENTTQLKVTVNDVPPKISVTSPVALGGDAQERSNPNHDTDEKREINTTVQKIIVTNAGSEQLSGIKGTASLAGGFSDNDLMVNFSLPKTTLAVGESMEVPVTVRVPQRLDAVESALLRPFTANIASITFSATPAVTSGTLSAISQLTLRAENNLIIKDVRVRFDGKSESVDNDDTIDNMKPGMDVEFEIEIENRFKDREDVTIEDVEVSVVSRGDLDIDEEDEVGDLGAEDKETITLSSLIDDDADDGTFDVEITADGVDEFGARHGERWLIKFEIERKSHEVSIESLTLSPSVVACDEETVLNVDIKNIGRRDEDDVFVNVASPELRFGDQSARIVLDKDDEDTVSFEIPVPASLARPATYRITVDTYYSTGTKSNSDVALLKVEKCGPAEEEPEEEEKPPAEEEKPPIIVVPPQEKPPVINKTPEQPPAEEKKPFLQTPQYMALLVLAYVVVLGGGLALLLKLLRKP